MQFVQTAVTKIRAANNAYIKTPLINVGGVFLCSLKLFKEKPKAYFDPILYIPVLQTGHFAFNAGLPFFMVTCSGLSTSLFCLHLTQYIDAMRYHLPSR